MTQILGNQREAIGERCGSFIWIRDLFQSSCLPVFQFAVVPANARGGSPGKGVSLFLSIRDSMASSVKISLTGVYPPQGSRVNPCWFRSRVLGKQLKWPCAVSPIWGICKSSVRHENQPVDIREFHDFDIEHWDGWG